MMGMIGTKNRQPGSMSLAAFVEMCLQKKGVCEEADILGFIHDSYKREWVIRYGARDCARVAMLGGSDCSEHFAVRFMTGKEISVQEAERLYRRGSGRLINDIRASCRKGRSGRVRYSDETKGYYMEAAKDCHEYTN